MSTKTYSKGEVIFRQGDFASEMRLGKLQAAFLGRFCCRSTSQRVFGSVSGVVLLPSGRS